MVGCCPPAGQVFYLLDGQWAWLVPLVAIAAWHVWGQSLVCWVIVVV